MEEKRTIGCERPPEPVMLSTVHRDQSGLALTGAVPIRRTALSVRARPRLLAPPWKPLVPAALAAISPELPFDPHGEDYTYSVGKRKPAALDSGIRSAYIGGVTGIYLIAHRPSGIVYVGQSVDIFARWGQHRHGLRGGAHTNHLLQAVYRATPEELCFCVLEQCDEEKLNEREAHWLQQFALTFNLLGRAADGSHRGRRTYTAPRLQGLPARSVAAAPRPPEVGLRLAVPGPSLSIFEGHPRCTACGFLLTESRARGWTEARGWQCVECLTRPMFIRISSLTEKERRVPHDR